MLFLLDSNVFIEAKNKYYAFDLVPAFWTFLEKQSLKGEVQTVLPVIEELVKGNDELKDWIEDRKDVLGLRVDEPAVQEKFRKIAEWVNSQIFSEGAKADFLSGADPWLIAKAYEVGATVVTQEVYKSDIKRAIPIPNVCNAFGIPYVNTFELLRQLGAEFR